ncbi:MAG: carbamoyltransferase HypF [bacterium]|nr:carbamoyltransferase HypF [bacterium]
MSSQPSNSGRIIRRRFEAAGRVQGVGFRPYIFRLATDQNLAGHVGNSPTGAFIEVEGPADEIEIFEKRIASERPPLVEIVSLQATDLPPEDEREFTIHTSTTGGEQKAEITADTTVCADCLREMFDPDDRRYRYPFINCTNCGPRYSIIQGVPYDRIATTMAAFTMCPDCRAEYDNPRDRRFHAQPNACPVCGPRAWLTDPTGSELPGDAIAMAASHLRDGKILAVKGLGGFHLACRADLGEAVSEMRRRKNREVKPLAVMVASLEDADRIVHLDDLTRSALTSLAHPIVLAPKRPDSTIADEVAPGTGTLGVLLPYTPLHELLLAERPGPLVMTSGNPSSEPLCRDNAEALERLGGIADRFLLHDRDIERRVDDSVVMGVELPGDSSASRIQPLRRARGFAPAPLQLESAAPASILAVGGELKSTVCLLSGHDAVLSEHLGDLDNPAAYRNFIATVERFRDLFDSRPALVACDLHPDYASTRFARELGLPLTEVQHHHAHIVSCLADNGLEGEVLGLSCDGTGFGTDGAVWGCELLACTASDFRRLGHLRYFPLLGGDAAARETWRPAAGLCRDVLGVDWHQAEPFIGRVDPVALTFAAGRFESGAGVPTSSLGRLFDAVAFLTGACDVNRCEAEAPMALEALAMGSLETGAEPLAWAVTANEEGLELDWRPLVLDLLERRRAGQAAGEIALAFHETLALMLAEAVTLAASTTGLDRVLFSGGSFANRHLLTRLWGLLRERGLAVYIHHRVPPGDGGLALGQALVASARLASTTHD